MVEQKWWNSSGEKYCWNSGGTVMVEQQWWNSNGATKVVQQRW